MIYEHQIYVIAKGVNATPTVYRFSRIHSAQRRTTKTFDYPSRAAYDPDVVFRDTFGIFVRAEDPVEDVVLRLDPRWRTYERTHRWHPSQSLDVEGPDLKVRMRVRTCPELEAFVLGFGEEAEVLEPAALRSRLASRASKLGRIYGAAPKARTRTDARSRNPMRNEQG